MTPEEQGLRALKDFGCWVWIELEENMEKGSLDTVLYNCPMLQDGTPAPFDEGGPVTHPESQAFLDAVNDVLNIPFKFTINDFEGEFQQGGTS